MHARRAVLREHRSHVRARLGLVAIAIAGGACGEAPAATDGRPEPAGYSVVADWAPSSRTLTGTEAIQVRDGGPGTLPHVWLRLWPNDSIPGEADGCRKPNIRIAALSGAKIVGYSVACSAVRLRLTEPLGAGETGTLSLRFRIRVPTYAAQFGRSAGIDLLGRALPVLAVRDGAGWHLNRDTATGDPGYSLAAAWRATVRVPPSLDVASTGVELSNTIDAGSRRRTVVVATPAARDFALAIGRLERRTATVDGVHVRVFSSPGRSGAPAARALRNAVSAMRTYTGWYGAYGSAELDVVVADLGDDSQEAPEIVFTDPDRGTVVHELAHQWFFGIVGDDQYREPWLDEAFAAWNEEQFVEGSYPCDVRRPLGAHRGGLSRGMSYYETRANQYVDVVYRGGACSLTALERLLGRNRFLSLLRTEVERYRYGVIHTRDFVALVGAVDQAVARRWTDLVGLPSSEAVLLPAGS